jgi:uncharacterized protein (DUF2384 family)
MTAITAERASAVEDDAVKLPIADVASYLQEHISQRMAAYLAGLGDSRQIGRYARGEHAPTSAIDRRLREGYKVVRLLVEAYDDSTARSWLFGTNTRLDDQAPIEVLQRATDTQTFIDVLHAARQFASVDW